MEFTQMGQIIDSAEALAIVHPKLGTLYWNSTAEKFTGITAAQAYHKFCYDVNPCLPQCNPECPYRVSLTNERIISSFEKQIITSSGKRMDFLTSVMHLRLAPDAEKLTLFLFRDITAQKQKEFIASRVLNYITQFTAKSEGNVTEDDPLNPLPFYRIGSLRTLTHREKEVITLLVAGKNTAEIASTLTISTVTTRNYMQRIFKKLRVHNRVELISFIYNFGSAEELKSFPIPTR